MNNINIDDKKSSIALGKIKRKNGQDRNTASKEVE